MTNTTINFNAIATSYNVNESVRHDFNEIFSRVASFKYWSKIAELQREGINNNNALFIEKNKENYCEKPEYVQNNIRVSLLKIIRYCCKLNCLIAKNGGERFLTTRFKKTEEGLFDLLDAMSLANDIADAYEKNVGISITETRWDKK